MVDVFHYVLYYKLMVVAACFLSFVCYVYINYLVVNEMVLRGWCCSYLYS